MDFLRDNNLDDIRMNKVIDAQYYFKIIDSELFGGEGSTGYAALSVEKKVSKEDYEKEIEEYRHSLSNMLEVKKNNIILISEDEYIENTEQ